MHATMTAPAKRDSGFLDDLMNRPLVINNILEWAWATGPTPSFAVIPVLAGSRCAGGYRSVTNLVPTVGLRVVRAEQASVHRLFFCRASNRSRCCSPGETRNRSICSSASAVLKARALPHESGQSPGARRRECRSAGIPLEKLFCRKRGCGDGDGEQL